MGFLFYHVNELPYSPVISPKLTSHCSPLKAWSQQKNAIKRLYQAYVGAFHRGAFVKLVSRRAMTSPPWTGIESTVLFWKLPKTDSPRTCNCIEGRSSPAATSVGVGCKRQYKSSSRFRARIAEIWTQCYQYMNIFPVLPFCFTLASTELRVPPLLPLVTIEAAVCSCRGTVKWNRSAGSPTSWLIWDCVGWIMCHPTTKLIY